MPKYHFHQAFLYCLYSQPTIADKDDFLCETENLEKAVELFAKHYNLVDVKAGIEPGGLENELIISGQDAEENSLIEYCSDCNDLHGYWIVEVQIE